MKFSGTERSLYDTGEEMYGWTGGPVYMGRIVGERGKESRASDNWRRIREADSMMMALRQIGGILVTYW